MPYKLIDKETFDAVTGALKDTFKYPTVLDNTVFIGLNSLACSMTNPHLYADFADPGNQLQFLKNKLSSARSERSGTPSRRPKLKERWYFPGKYERSQ